MYSERNPKIDIFVGGTYRCSTNWSKTCKEAKKRFIEKNPTIDERTIKVKRA